ncbi:MAG TPA: hypothetical protein VIQ53_19855, partial [Inquilinus sp.]
MSSFLRTLALTAVAVGAIACVPQDGSYGNGSYGNGSYNDGYYGDSGSYGDGGYTRIDDRYRRNRNDNDRANSCRRAYDGECDEGRYGGSNRCD